MQEKNKGSKYITLLVEITYEKCLFPYQIRQWNILQKCIGPRFNSDSSRDHTNKYSDSFQANPKDKKNSKEKKKPKINNRTNFS